MVLKNDRISFLNIILKIEANGSDGKESVCNAGDSGLIPGLGRPWRAKWQPTPAFLPGKSHGERSLAGYSLWGHKESDTTERLAHRHTNLLPWPPKPYMIRSPCVWPQLLLNFPPIVSRSFSNALRSEPRAFGLLVFAWLTSLIIQLEHKEGLWLECSEEHPKLNAFLDVSLPSPEFIFSLSLIFWNELISYILTLSVPALAHKLSEVLALGPT